MWQKLLKFYTKSSPIPREEDPSKQKSRYKKLQWSVFLSATVGYSLFYVCRLSLSVVKKPILNEGLMNETQLGVIGSALFFTYAVGRFVNGFLADRSNIRRFMSTGLFVSAIINLILGFNTWFILFVVLWGFNGWVQSMGAAPSIVGLTRWFGDKERGTYYGIWSTSHSSGNALTYIVTSLIVGAFGWRWGFSGAAFVGAIGALIIAKFLRDTPESEGLPPIAEFKNEIASVSSNEKTISSLQLSVLKNPYVWILALSSAFMYVSRYAIESWGIFYLETAKSYSNLQASSVLSIYAAMGIISTILCGIISDKFFNGNRNVPALFFGLINVVGITLFLYSPAEKSWLSTLGIAFFGLGTGALITYLGGLMAIDIVSKKAAGAAVGICGIASYLGAGIQDVVSGSLIQKFHVISNGVESYDYTYVKLFWVSAAAVSVVLTCLVWNAKEQEPF